MKVMVKTSNKGIGSGMHVWASAICPFRDNDGLVDCNTCKHNVEGVSLHIAPKSYYSDIEKRADSICKANMSLCF